MDIIEASGSPKTIPCWGFRLSRPLIACSGIMQKLPRILALDSSDAKSCDAALNECRDVIEGGGVVIIPTDTVYGLASLSNQPRAVRRIFEIKNRPLERPLALLVSSRTSPGDYGIEEDTTLRALLAYWPGPMTIVGPTRTDLPEGLRGEGNTVGVRSPDHAWVQRLLDTLPVPLAATSANLSSEPEACSVSEMDRGLLERVDLIVDAGSISSPLASTVVMKRDDEWTIVREGSIPRHILERRLKGT